MRRILKFLTSRMVWVAIVMMLQVAWVVAAVLFLGRYYWAITVVLSLIGLSFVMYITQEWYNPAYKLAWSILILSVPILGTILYLFFGRGNTIIAERRKHRHIDEELHPLMEQPEGVAEELLRENPAVARQFSYLYRTAHYPAGRNGSTHYFSGGEEYFEELCGALNGAEHFIFLEYFIIERGYMWETILDILTEKAEKGVEVRLLYDDVGCIWLLPRNYPDFLEKRGIVCRRFNLLRPVMSAVFNNRDHRKIAVIDGHTAFCGGLNLADEYINRKERFGHWKDGGVVIRGEAVWNYTAMYLSMWNAIRHTDFDYGRYRVDFASGKQTRGERAVPGRPGYVLPYGDSPLDHECIGENVYLNILHNAKRYVYIYTPYLIIDQEMTVALELAAKSGVDIRIMTPHISDKKLIFMLTRSYYARLLDAGVRIYEYLPGFLHTKAFVSDDELAAVGSINLDYRSLYLHFECGALLYRTEAVLELKEDFVRTMERETMEITPEFCRRRPLYERLLVSAMHLFEPLF